MQGVSSLEHLPMDVTLKLSDGSIKINKMMLGIVSPVFKNMLYGSFKEASSSEVDLPKDNYKIIKLLFDVVFGDSFELESLDDIIPLMEVVDRYQIKKVQMLRMWDEVILAKFDSSNYIALLQKFSDVMSVAGMEEATNKVMRYCNNNLASNFDSIKDLPEEIVLFLLQRNDIDNLEVDLLYFLLRWYNYHAKELSRTLHLLPQLFNSIRYFLISPRLLLTKVASCRLVDKQILIAALNNVYTKSLGESPDKQNGPRLLSNIQWIVNGKGGNITYDEQEKNLCCFKFSYEDRLVSKKLKNGIYHFDISSDSYCDHKLSVHHCSTDSFLYEIPIKPASNNCTINLFVYREDIFMKTIMNREVLATYSITASSVCIEINAKGGTTLKIRCY